MHLSPSDIKILSSKAPGGSDSKESACSAGDLCSIARLGRFPGEGNDYVLQYCCRENGNEVVKVKTVAV